MDFVRKIELRRCIRKLKSARALSLEEQSALLEQTVSLGSAAINPSMRCLSHADARALALQILDRLLDDQTYELFVQALVSPNPVVVAGVSKVLAHSTGYDAVPLLDLMTDPDIPRAILEPILMGQSSRIPAHEVLARMGMFGPELRPLLFRLLEQSTDGDALLGLLPLTQHEDPWVRMQSAKLLGRHQDQKIIEALVALLEDQSKHVRLVAVNGLRSIGDPQTGFALAQRLRDPDLKVQTAAIDALVSIGGEVLVPHLLEVLKDESEHARRGAVEVLNEVATTQAIQDLLKALRDADWWVRVRAADALGSLGGEKVVEAVLGLLRDEDEFVRRYAVEILNSVPSERAVQTLVDALADEDWWVRERSIDALGTIGNIEAVQPLLDLMRIDEQAAPLCIRSLRRIGDPRIVDPICALVNSEREDVRREATETLRVMARRVASADEKKKILTVLDTAARSGMAREGGSESRNEKSTHVSPLFEATPQPAEQTVRLDSNPPIQQTEHAFSQLHFGSLQPGMLLLDRYRIIDSIGHGGFGAVYLVDDVAIQEQIILKVLNPLLSGNEMERRRFIQELTLTRKITHRNVIRIYDFLDLGGVHAVSMEHFPGQDLGHILDDKGALDHVRVLKMILQICDGLTAAHDAGVVHRDIKPSNILVGNDDEVKIVDFGLAWAQKRVGSRLTKSGLLIGTPEYMAPELIQGDTADHRVDIYSVGIMMYEMLSGQKPYSGDNPVRILFQHLEGEQQPLRELVEDVPERVVDLVERCMSREVGARPADFRSLRMLVEEALQRPRSLERESHG